jgi:prepilin-type N-terminal cleavage/methylation domain-containing protein
MNKKIANKQNIAHRSYLVSLFARGRMEGVSNAFLLRSPRGGSPDSVGITRTDSVEPVQAFTLLELLLVIAVIAILAGIILFALNPAQRLEDANSAQTIAKSDDIRKAIEAYVIDHAGSMPTNLASLTTYGIYDICKAGQSTNCLNLDQLVTDGYLGSIPEDKDGSTTVISGYKLEYNPTKNNVQVYNTDNFSDYVDDGATLTTGLVGYWKMDENTGTTATDASGNGNTGTLTNGPTWTFGRYASAVNFDGVNDNIDISPDYFPNYFDFTVSAWILLDPSTYSTSDYFPIFGNNQNNPFLGFNPVNNTIVHFRQHTTSSQTLLWGSITMLEDTNWHHISLTVDQNRLQAKLYIDGLFISSQTIGNEGYTHANGSLKAFGKDYAGYWKGSLDELRIYSRALYTEEISALYNYAPPAIAHWKFDEGSGTTAVDSSGSGNNGTLSNGPNWTTGKYGNALNLDGIDDYGNVSQPNSIYTPNNWTITGWIYPANQANGNIITPNSHGIDQWVGYDNTNQRLFIQITEIIDINNRTRYSTNNSVLLNQWTHIALNINDKNLKIYLNGNLNAEFNESINIGGWTGNWYIGQRGNSTRWYQGRIDDLRVYPYILTQTQIQKVMNNEI